MNCDDNSEDLFNVLHAVFALEVVKVGGRADQHDLAKMPGVLVAEAGGLLAGADAAAKRRLLGLGIKGGRGFFLVCQR